MACVPSLPKSVLALDPEPQPFISKQSRSSSNAACLGGGFVAVYKGFTCLQSLWRARRWIGLRSAVRRRSTIVRPTSSAREHPVALHQLPSSSDVAAHLADPNVLACLLPRSGRSLALDGEWRAKLEQVPAFDVSVVLDMAPCGTMREPPASWSDRLAQQLPTELQSQEWRTVVRETLLEAEALLHAFQPAGALALAQCDLVAPLRIRVACLHHVQCSRFHWDDVPLRAISVLAGAGTDVLPEASVERNAFAALEQLPLEQQVAMSADAFNQGVVRAGLDPEAAVARTPPGRILFLKGSEWQGMSRSLAQGKQLGAVHRSPPMDGKRVLLQVDFADAVFTPEVISTAEHTVAGDWSSQSSPAISQVASVVMSVSFLFLVVALSLAH